MSPGILSVTGLAWTSVGGDLLTIEALRLPGKGRMKTTGKLGDVMKESIDAASSYVRSISPELGIFPPEFERMDIHVHVPEGAIPKDGPSAGVAIATALVSAFFDIPVRRDIAMTGEVTLRGKVLPVGGINEKSVAALRAGVKKLLLPKGNKKNIKELPKEVRRGLQIVVVDSMEEVLVHALSKKLDWGIKRRKQIGGLFQKQPGSPAN